MDNKRLTEFSQRDEKVIHARSNTLYFTLLNSPLYAQYEQMCGLKNKK